MLETVYVGDNYKLLLADLSCWWPILYIELVTNMTKNHQHNDSVTNMTLAVSNTIMTELWIVIYDEILRYLENDLLNHSLDGFITV